jgi:hypothetical protein
MERWVRSCRRELLDRTFDLAVMASACSVAAIEEWLHELDDIARARLGFGRGVPAANTLWRLLVRLDADLLATVLAGWLRTRTGPAGPRRPRYRQVIAIDGKTLRGAHRGDGGHVHLLSALDTSTGLVPATHHPQTTTLQALRKRLTTTPERGPTRRSAG